jgi:hypothetical protein
LPGARFPGQCGIKLNNQGEDIPRAVLGAFLSLVATALHSKTTPMSDIAMFRQQLVTPCKITQQEHVAEGTLGQTFHSQELEEDLHS